MNVCKFEGNVMKLFLFLWVLFPLYCLSDSGLQVLYTFESVKGDIIKDRSGVGIPLDLKISSLKNVRRTAGALQINKAAVISSDKLRIPGGYYGVEPHQDWPSIHVASRRR